MNVIYDAEYDPERDHGVMGVDPAKYSDLSIMSNPTTVFAESKYIGHWKIHDGDVSFHVTHRRPNFIVRFCTKFLLGWEWFDA